MSVKVVVIDRQPVVRVGLTALLGRDGRAEVVGEANDAHDGYAVVERTRPQVVVAERALPGEDGISATRELKRRWRDLRVLLTANLVHLDEVVEALDAGALGVALKHQAGDELVEAVLTVAAGRNYLPPGVAADALRERASLPRRDTTPIGCLSRRERDVFGMFVRGRSNQDVARELFISVKTVETHRGHIFEKLGVHSMADLVRFAATRGLLPTEA